LRFCLHYETSHPTFLGDDLPLHTSKD
jgi:hypothetical protein